MTFTKWLLDYAEEDSPRGDLARDVAVDPDWPRQERGRIAFEEYLSRLAACEGARRALRDAWQDWEKVKNHD